MAGIIDTSTRPLSGYVVLLNRCSADMEPIAKVDVRQVATNTVEHLKGMYALVGVIFILSAIPTLILRSARGPIMALWFWNGDAWRPVGVCGLAVGTFVVVTAFGLHRQRRWALGASAMIEWLCVAWLVSFWCYFTYVMVAFHSACDTKECDGYWPVMSVVGVAWTAATVWAAWRCHRNASLLRQALAKEWR
jgi:hypothetical protein